MSESEEIVIRKLCNSDSLEYLTDLLHRAYKALADLGLNYFATHQTVEQTRQRINRGTVFVALQSGVIVGTIFYRSPDISSPIPWYDRDDIAYVGQLAVEPDLQRREIATKMMRFAEKRARADGARELSLDTAETATHLIAWYERMGYRFIEYADWYVTNYRSVIMSKRLG